MARSLAFQLCVIAVLVVAGCGFSAAEAETTATAWKQPEFLISFWVDPIVPVSEFDAQYKLIANANFSVVLGGFGAITPPALTAQLAACKKYGLGAIVNPAGLPPSGLPPISDTCWGYQIKDEPPASDFPYLASLNEHIRSIHPTALNFINLLPNYATLHQLNATSYDAYVSEFVSTVKPQILCMDYYPMMQPSGDTREGYAGNMAVLRKYGLANNLPIWNFFNSMPFGPHIDPTEAQMRWQVWTSLAYGAKGVLYFTYWTPKGGIFQLGGGIMTPEGPSGEYVPGAHYWHAQRINSVLKAWGPTLMDLTSSGVYRVPPMSDPGTILQGCAISNLTQTGHHGALNYLIGQFTRASDGATAVLLNNWEWPTVTFAGGAGVASTAKEVDPMTGAEVPLLDDSPGTKGLQLRLAPGSGRLIILTSN